VGIEVLVEIAGIGVEVLVGIAGTGVNVFVGITGMGVGVFVGTGTNVPVIGISVGVGTTDISPPIAVVRNIWAATQVARSFVGAPFASTVRMNLTF